MKEGGQVGLLAKLRGVVSSPTVQAWLPEPKVAAAAASSGAVALVVWVAGKRGYKIPRRNLEKVVTGLVALGSSIPPVVAYVKSNKPSSLVTP